MKIILLGYMGSGKTEVGKVLSDKLGVRFLDLDMEIEKATGKSIARSFQEDGELAFRRLERSILLDRLSLNSDFVLATGGGTPCYYDNMDQILCSHAISIYLRIPIAILTERLSVDLAKRPLIAHLKPSELNEFVAKHLFERRTFYERADWTIDVGELSASKIAEMIVDRYPNSTE